MKLKLVLMILLLDEPESAIAMPLREPAVETEYPCRLSDK